MENDSPTRTDAVSNDAVPPEERELIQKVSETILDARDVLEKKAQDEAEAVFERIAKCVWDLSTYGTIPKKDGTTVERRMCQLVLLANDFCCTFRLIRRIQEQHKERSLTIAYVTGYRLGKFQKAQNAQVASQTNPQRSANASTSAGESPRSSSSATTVSGADQNRTVPLPVPEITTTKRVPKRKNAEVNIGCEPPASSSSPEENGNAAKKRSTRSSNTSDVSGTSTSKKPTRKSSKGSKSRVFCSSSHCEDGWEITEEGYYGGPTTITRRYLGVDAY